LPSFVHFRFSFQSDLEDDQAAELTKKFFKDVGKDLSKKLDDIASEDASTENKQI